MIKKFNEYKMNEEQENIDYNEIIDEIQEVQEQLREAVQTLNQIRRKLGNNITADRLRSYIISHLETLIDSNHDWLDRSTNLQDIIEELQDEPLSEEDEPPSEG